MPERDRDNWADRFFEEQKERWRQAVSAIDRVDARVDDLAREVARLQVHMEGAGRLQTQIDNLRTDVSDAKSRMSEISTTINDYGEVKKLAHETRESLSEFRGRMLVIATLLATFFTALINYGMKRLGGGP